MIPTYLRLWAKDLNTEHIIALPAVPFPGAALSLSDTNPFAVTYNNNNFVIVSVEFLGDEPAIIAVVMTREEYEVAFTSKA